MAFPGGLGWNLTLTHLTSDVANWLVQVQDCPHRDLIDRFSQALGAMNDDENTIDTTSTDPWDATQDSLPPTAAALRNIVGAFDLHLQVAGQIAQPTG